MARQGRGLCHTGSGGSLRAPSQRLLQQCGGPAAIRDREPSARGRHPHSRRREMSETAVVDRMFGETRLALLDPDGRLLEIHHFRDEDALRPGDIHRGRVTAAAPALSGAFVSIGAETVLLKAPPRAIPPEGSPVVVTIRRLARPPKLATAALCDPPPGHEVAGPPGLLFREAEPWLALLDARGTE